MLYDIKKAEIEMITGIELKLTNDRDSLITTGDIQEFTIKSNEIIIKTDSEEFKESFNDVENIHFYYEPCSKKVQKEVEDYLGL